MKQRKKKKASYHQNLILVQELKRQNYVAGSGIFNKVHLQKGRFGCGNRLLLFRCLHGLKFGSKEGCSARARALPCCKGYAINFKVEMEVVKS